MLNALLITGLLGVAIYGAWITAHARHTLGTQHRRRKVDP